MKRTKSIGLFLLFGASLMLLGFLLGIYYLEENSLANPDLNLSSEKEQAIPEYKEDAFAVANITSEKLSATTKYVIWDYNVDTEEISRTESKVPVSYIGMDREEFIRALQNYRAFPPLFELEKGFVGLNVESFSRNQVVIKKFYKDINRTEGYYLCFVNNYVFVYKKDRKTLYMETAISESVFPDNIKAKIINGYYIDTQEELFHFLETYSS